MLQDSPYKRIILIATGWPIMPWFWDPVAMSSQIPLSLPNLPNLLTKPFNQIPHRNLTNRNLDARLLEPQHSRSRASLRRWQQEWRLLKRDQPDQSMRQVDHCYKWCITNQVDLLDSFHRDRPRGRRGIPSWNLSLVLHQLNKALFEPIKEASLEHLTFKMVFF